MNNFSFPDGHPITIDKAKASIAGDLGDVYRNILKSSCLPIYWYEMNNSPSILHNGTMTIMQTPEKLLGITAAHVLESFKEDSKNKTLKLQLENEVVDNILDRVINTSSTLDIATIELDISLLQKMSKDITPLNFPPSVPRNSGGGIMLAGYPGIDRAEEGRLEVNFGLFTALGVVSSVTQEQITWRVEREFHVTNSIPDLPVNHDLGGISGGPLIAWFESPNFITQYRLAGIISEAQSNLEYVVAKRADFIQSDGTLSQTEAYLKQTTSTPQQFE